MEKVLVTGGSGYIGLHCISLLLKEGYAVRTSLRSMKRKKEIQEALSGSIKNNDRVVKSDHVYLTSNGNLIWVSHMFNYETVIQENNFRL